MSEQNKESTEEIKQEAPKEEFVSKKAYSDVSNDMHKYKSELKDVKAMLNQLQAEKSNAEKEVLAEQGKWQELHAKTQEELDTVKAENANNNTKFIDYHKKNSVLNEIGGFKRDEYNSFIDVSKVALNEDGSIEQESLKLEVDRIKQQYPELLKKSSTTRLPNEAPQGNDMGDMSSREMNDVQKNEYFKQLLTKK